MSKSMTDELGVGAASAFVASATSRTSGSCTCGGSFPTETDDGQAAQARRRALRAGHAAPRGAAALARGGLVDSRNREALEAVAQDRAPAACARARAQAAIERAASVVARRVRSRDPPAARGDA